MKVLFVAAECSPFVKVGGLADVIGSLPQVLQKRRDVQVRVILPLYKSIPEKYQALMEPVKRFFIEIGENQRVHVGLKTLVHDRVRYFFIANNHYFGSRKGIYNYPDDAERYTFFQKAVIESFPYLLFEADIVHVHDWHTAMIPLLLKTKYSKYREKKSITTIHNLAYQGIFPINQYLPFNMEFDYRFEFDGYLNFLKTGLVSSDFITTVSPTYAKEIITDYFGYGMQRLLKLRHDTIKGIINGISYEEFNPETDPLIAKNYGAQNYKEGKIENKNSLYEELKADFDPQTMLVGMVTRLVSQKGLELLKRVFDEIMANDNLKFILIGDGEPEYVAYFNDLAARYPHKVRLYLGYNNRLAHRLYAASDLFLMPSKFEPCGLGQLIALKYGSLPLVRETGGLIDTVKPYNEFDKTGNGFSFSHFNAHDMMHVLRYALSVYQNDPFAWDMLVERAMNEDFSWSRSADEYIALYKILKKKKRE
jgi:starch synthase